MFLLVVLGNTKIIQSQDERRSREPGVHKSMKTCMFVGMCAVCTSMHGRRPRSAEPGGYPPASADYLLPDFSVFYYYFPTSTHTIVFVPVSMLKEASDLIQ